MLFQSHRRDGGDNRREHKHDRDHERKHRSRVQPEDNGRPIKQEKDIERSQRRERERNDQRRREARRERERNPPQEPPAEEEPAPKEGPNFEVSGKLTEETNTYRGVVIKYSEPQEARKPRKKWRLYPFKGEEALPVMHIHRQSAYLIGRDRIVADIAVDHPSCSKQHAVLQYRLVSYKREDGSVGRRVRPYVIDLNSANGTFVNNKKIEPQRYVELLEKDVVKFAFSSREYVLLHDNCQTDEPQDDEGTLSD